MRITVFGAAGQVGRRVVAEALRRGHEVTAVVRNQEQIHTLPAGAITRIGDAGCVRDVAALSGGQDVVISAVRSASSDVREVISTTRALLDGLTCSAVRLLVVGGAASLIVPGTNGRTVLDDPRFLPPSARPIGEASLAQHQECLADSCVDWAYLSPPAQLVPGERTGQYRLGRDHLLIDDEGKSRISVEDLAVVLLDEVMNPKHHKIRFTAAY